MTSLRVSALATSLLLGGLGPSAQLALHQGATDPTAGGWKSEAGTGQLVGPLEVEDAWFVEDASTAPGSSFSYRHPVSPCDAAVVEQVGWTLTACLRVQDANALDGGMVSSVVSYDTGSRRYDMWFTNLPGGEVQVRLLESTQTGCSVSGPTWTLDPDVPGCHLPGYHEFALVYQPATQTAALTVDGVKVLSGYGGHTIELGGPRVSFGTGSSCGDGAAAFHRVELRADGPLEVCQQDLGLGGPGSLSLSVCGEPLTCEGGSALLQVHGASPGTTVYLPVGFDYQPTPLGAGVVVPVPPVLIVPLATDATGSASLPVQGGGGPAVTLYVQAVDVAGLPFGFSNAVAVVIGS